MQTECSFWICELSKAGSVLLEFWQVLEECKWGGFLESEWFSVLWGCYSELSLTAKWWGTCGLKQGQVSFFWKLLTENGKCIKCVFEHEWSWFLLSNGCCCYFPNDENILFDCCLKQGQVRLLEEVESLFRKWPRVSMNEWVKLVVWWLQVVFVHDRKRMENGEETLCWARQLLFFLSLDRKSWNANSKVS